MVLLTTSTLLQERMHQVFRVRLPSHSTGAFGSRRGLVVQSQQQITSMHGPSWECRWERSITRSLQLRVTRAVVRAVSLYLEIFAFRRCVMQEHKYTRQADFRSSWEDVCIAQEMTRRFIYPRSTSRSRRFESNAFKMPRTRHELSSLFRRPARARLSMPNAPSPGNPIVSLTFALTQSHPLCRVSFITCTSSEAYYPHLRSI